MSIPKQQKALVLQDWGKWAVKTVSVPDPEHIPPGAVLVKVLCAAISPNAPLIHNSHGHGPQVPSRPFTTGLAAIARVVAVGPDATKLKHNDLVYVDGLVRVRDDPDGRGVLIWGYFSFEEAGAKLAENAWKEGCNAEYAQAPMENCYLLNEKRLLGDLGYTLEDLAYIERIVVPYSGFIEVGLKAGETVCIAPATGSFAGSGIHAALAMGAHVVAAGSNEGALKRIMETFGSTGRITTAKLTRSDPEADAQAIRDASPNGAIDAYIDIVPFNADNSTLLKSGILALRYKGRACLMGGCRTDVPVPYSSLLLKNIQLFGRPMYERETPAELIRLIETGLLPLGEKAGFKTLGTFSLEDYEKAFEAARNETPGMQTQACFRP